MDNLTHSLVGWALAETGLKRRTRKGLAACILAANMPDIDVFFGWVPWAPLAMHRGFTHGLIGGVVLMPPLLAGLLWLLDRWQAWRGVTFASRLEMRFGWLVALCYLGALTHPLLDLQNVYAVQLLSPFSNDWFHADGLFIIDPWIWFALCLGIWLSRRRGGTLGIAAIVACAAVIAYIGLNMGISQLARRAPQLEAPLAHPDRIFTAPEPLRFWRRDVLWREQGVIRRGRFDLTRGRSLFEITRAHPDNMSDPLIPRAARSSKKVRQFLAWSVMPTAEVIRRRCVALVTFGDARFSDRRFSDSFIVSTKVATMAPGCPST